MSTALNQASFAGGELAPSLHARSDLAKFATGLALCSNFFVHAHGGVSNRPGFEYVDGVQDHSKKVRLIEFAFSTVQTYVLEFGHNYMRIVKDGGRVVYPAGHAQEGLSVEVSTPYTESDLPLIKFVQSADIMTLVHPAHPVRELARTDHHEWTLSVISFYPEISKPTGLALDTNTVGSGSTDRKYVVTAAAAETLEESEPSDELSFQTDTDSNWTEGEYLEISWTAVSGAEKYNVYKEENGLFGYIGSTESASFKDTKFAPDLSDTPPKVRNPFDGANYPGSATYYQQRLVFAQSTAEPQSIWTTQTGNYKNMNVSSPVKDDDAITFTIASRQVNEIRHLVPLDQLIVLTSGGEWKVSGGNDGVITPTTIQVRPQGYRGSSHVPPLLIGNTVLFIQEKGAIVRDLAYSLESDGYAGNDLSVMANHLFDGHTIIDWCFAQAPHSIVWAVRDDGVLLGLTYVREHQVWAWHQHPTTNGAFESICSISENGEDAVYAVVRRTINGQEKRYVERLHSRQFTESADAFFVDSGLSYQGAEVSSISGLDHLEGEAVWVLADGHVEYEHTVTGGAIALQHPASQVHIGLPLIASLKTLPVDLQGQSGSLKHKEKSINRVNVHFLESRGGYAGTDKDSMQELVQRQFEDWGESTRLQTGVEQIDLQPDWNNHGQTFIEQRDPLPMTILAVIPEVTFA